MTTVKLYYLNGDLLQLDSCATVGSIMTQVAMMHDMFACDIAVVHLDTGKDLTDPPSQAPPPAMSVVLKQANDRPAKEDLILTALLHAEHEDIATCTRALDVMRRLYPSLDLDFDILQRLLKDDTEGQQKMVHTLVRAGVDGVGTLCHACYEGDKKTVEALLAAGVPPDGEEVFHDTPLIEASAMGYTDVVEILLSNGAQVDLADNNGTTALIKASKFGQKDVVEILLSNGAQIDHADHAGKTALIKASKYGEKDTVEILLSNGAGDDRKSWQFNEAVWVAWSEDVKEILCSHGARR